MKNGTRLDGLIKLRDAAFSGAEKLRERKVTRRTVYRSPTPLTAIILEEVLF
jgi:hypothetical protein